MSAQFLSRVGILTAVALAFTIATPAQASILFGPAVRYETLKTTDNGTGFAGGTNDSNQLVGDMHVGLLIEGTPVYIGGLYSYEAYKMTSSNSFKGSSYGASVGYYSGALSLIGTYIIGGDRTYTNVNQDSKLSGGSGYRIDFAYVAGLTPAIGFGPQLTYQSIKYSKSQLFGSAETSNSFEVTSFTPGVVMWFRF